MEEYKEYLGDAVYVKIDDFGIILTTEDGIKITNRIVLEPSTIDSLVTYIEKHKKLHNLAY
jgi:hypothetical protein